MSVLPDDLGISDDDDEEEIHPDTPITIAMDGTDQQANDLPQVQEVSTDDSVQPIPMFHFSPPWTILLSQTGAGTPRKMTL